jgi:alpha-L-fucosidase
LYLFVEGKPTGPIALKGVKNGVARIRVVGDGSMINHEVFNKLYWSSIPVLSTFRHQRSAWIKI